MRRVFVDASAFITLARIGRVDLLRDIGEQALMPKAVINEIQHGAAAEALDSALEEWIESFSVDAHMEMRSEIEATQRRAAAHLGLDPEAETGRGDLALLTVAMHFGLVLEDSVVVITDDKPLRNTCKTLSIPISGSIGMLIASVERGDLEPDEAKSLLVAMDEVGARLSARLLRRAERLIDEVA